MLWILFNLQWLRCMCDVSLRFKLCIWLLGMILWWFVSSLQYFRHFFRFILCGLVISFWLFKLVCWFLNNIMIRLDCFILWKCFSFFIFHFIAYSLSVVLYSLLCFVRSFLFISFILHNEISIFIHLTLSKLLRDSFWVVYILTISWITPGE